MLRLANDNPARGRLRRSGGNGLERLVAVRLLMTTLEYERPMWLAALSKRIDLCSHTCGQSLSLDASKTHAARGNRTAIDSNRRLI